MAVIHGMNTMDWQQPQVLRDLVSPYRWGLARIDGQTKTAAECAALVTDARRAGFPAVQLILRDVALIPSIRVAIDPPLRISSPNEPDVKIMANMTATQVGAWVRAAWPLCQNAGYELDAGVISNLTTNQRGRGLQFLKTLWTSTLSKPGFEGVNVDVHCYDGWANIPALFAIIGARPWILSEFGYQTSASVSEAHQAALMKARFDWLDDPTHAPGLIAAIYYQLNRHEPDATFGVLSEQDGHWLPGAKIFVGVDPIPVVDPDVQPVISLEGSIPTAIVRAELVNFDWGGCQTFGTRLYDAQGGDETCTIVPLQADQVAILSPNRHQWLSVQPDGTWQGRPSNTTPGLWETFTRAGGLVTEARKDGVRRDPVQLLAKARLTLESPGGALETSTTTRLRVDGYYLKNAADQDVFIRGESAFLDYYRWLRGEDVDPLLRQSRDFGGNCRRLFLMTKYTGEAGGIGVCNPDDWGPGFFDRLPTFAARYAAAGQYLYLCALPDNQLIPGWGQQSKQVQFWSRLGEVCQTIPNVFAVELTNEADAHTFNAVDPTAFHKIPGVISCAGSRGPTGADPMPAPQWDLCDFHFPRQYPNCVVDGCVANHPSRIQQGKAILGGEPLGFGDKALNGNREDNPRIAREIAGSTRGTCCGVFFHTQHGGFSQLYDATEQACGRAWFGALAR